MILFLITAAILIHTQASLYDILGVKSTASDREISKAFKKYCLEYHPDVSTAHRDKYAELVSAYEILKDSNKRAIYDSNGHAQGRGLL